jgi:hypothetical protein
MVNVGRGRVANRALELLAKLRGNLIDNSGVNTLGF